MIERTWDEVLTTLLERAEVPAAQAAAELLSQVRPGWEGRVRPDLRKHDLRFVAMAGTGDGGPEVRVSWADGIYTAELLDERRLLVAADRCRRPNAPAVLTSFLEQLPPGRLI